jgi:hypothetical protein
MNDHIAELVSHYGSETSLALAHLMNGEAEIAIEILEDLVAFILSQDPSSSQENDQPFPNPGQGQMQPDGSYYTVQTWFADAGWIAPVGPNGDSVPSDFIWAPNAPNQDSSDWATAEWVWRPPLG